MSLRRDVEFWQRSCLRKKGMKEEHANEVIARAKAEGNFLRSYLCEICCRYHVTKAPAKAVIVPVKKEKFGDKWRPSSDTPPNGTKTKVQIYGFKFLAAKYEDGTWIDTNNGCILKNVVYWKDIL